MAESVGTRMRAVDEAGIKKLRAYLDGLAASDELFAAKYADPRKSVEQCWEYIIGVAKAEAVRNRRNGERCLGIGYSAERVYAEAVHYFEEDDVKAPEVSDAEWRGHVGGTACLTQDDKDRLKAEAEAEYKARCLKEAEARQAELRKKAEKPRKREAVQLSLFDEFAG